MDHIFQILSCCEFVQNKQQLKNILNQGNSLVISKKKIKDKKNVTLLFKSIRNPNVLQRKIDVVNRIILLDISIFELFKISKNNRLDGRIIIMKPIKMEQEFILKTASLVNNIPAQSSNQHLNVPEPAFSSNWEPTVSSMYQPSLNQQNTPGQSMQPSYETSPQWLDLSLSTSFTRFNRK